MANRKAYKELYNSLAPFPNNSPSYEVEFIIKKEDYSKVFLGICPMNMEDKWFVYEENNEIYMYRSWTDVCIAKLFIKELDNKDYSIYNIQINGDKFEYKSKGKKEDINMIIDELQLIFNIKVIGKID